MKFPLLLVTLGMTLLTGCTNRLTDFTVISTKNVELSTLGRAKRATARVEGKDTAHIIIFIPTCVPSVKEAIDRAIESVPGSIALVDGVVYQKFFWIPYIYGQSSFVVEGTPLINPAQASHILPAKHMVATYNAKQKRFVTEAISAERYATLKAKLASTHSTKAEMLQ